MSVHKTENIEVEIEILKSEAAELLDRMFHIPKDCSSERHRRLVDCIISAAILEIENINAKVTLTEE